MCMMPNESLITIDDNLRLIRELLMELMLEPRLNAIRWSLITRQTPNIKIGYPGQHLASLITGMEGERTGARGNDLVDGSEVKSCSRIDQLDKCNDCRMPVARLENVCPSCGSDNIHRNNDSKWLFTIRSEEELNTLIHEVGRVLLILGDYAHFDTNDFETLRFQAFEIWPESERNSRFSELMSNYYHRIYLEHRRRRPNSTPAPKNFWPYTYQFYLCNPICTFHCLVYEANTNPRIEITHYVNPSEDRAQIASVIMPPEILNESEIDQVLASASNDEIMQMVDESRLHDGELPDTTRMTLAEKSQLFVGIDEVLRSYLELRDTDRIAIARTPYRRRPTQ